MPANNIKLVFDISVLGMGTRNPTARTGVFRTIENMLEGFIGHPDLTLSLSTARQHLDPTLEYLNQKGFPSIEIKEMDSPGSRKGVWLHKMIPQREKSVTGFKEKPVLHTGGPVKTDIFHSPWLPIPKSYSGNRKVRCFITIHDLIPVLFPDFFTEANVNQFKKNLESITPGTFVICNSQSTRQDLLDYRQDLDPAKVFVTYWAASSIFYPVRDPAKLTSVLEKYKLPEMPYLLSLATIEPRKNIRTLLHAFRELVLQEKLSDLNLILVGTKGWKYQEILTFLESTPEITSRVFFTGYVADSDLAAIYSGALAFVYPSFYEGFGLPPLEAMQCGVPVICSNTSSLPEVVGEAGILLDPNDQQAISEMILTLYGNPRKRLALSASSLEQARKFSWKDCIEVTLSAYRESNPY